jgi:hypothetical protein
MKSHKDRTVMVYDHGIFVELAVTLAKEFGRVLYYAPWENAYPKSNAPRIGYGLPGVERVSEPWSHYDDIDLWVFPDVYEGALQEHLVKQGKRVWGCRLGEELEIDRAASKEMCKDAGIDIGKWKRIIGMDALRKHLQANDDQWVKVSGTRGDMETFHAPTYDQVDQRLHELEHNLGAKNNIMEFIVEAGINPAIETGYDGYCIDGKYPRGAMTGVEIKDQCYILRTIPYRDLPGAVRSVNDKLAPMLKQYGYRGFISTEIRCTPDGKAYLIDPCARCGSPPSELYQLMIGNLGDVMYEGAGGIMVEPEFKAKWGAQILIDSEWADANWQHVTFPKSVREHVKLRNMTVIDGEYYVIPQWTGCPQIGAVVAMGDTAKEAMDECKRIAELVEGYSLDKSAARTLEEAHADLVKILGDKASDKPKSRIERAADRAVSSGRMSDKQRERLIEREGA